MNTSDIFLKLLPFTYSENNETFFGISKMTGSDWIITIAFFILVVIFLGNLINLWGVKGKQDKDRLDELDYQLSENLAEIETALDKKSLSAWQNFKKSLIQDSNGQYYRVYDADFFFNKSSLLNKTGANSFASVPSVLLSLGLLGTFIGLFYGLVQLDLDNAETLKESMRTLIHASGAKFASSIWGLGLSVVFAWRIRKHETKIESKIHSIQNKINTIFPLQLSEQSLVNTEQGLAELLIELKNPTGSLKHLNELEDFTGRFDGLSDILKEQKATLNGLSLDIAEKLKESLSNSLLVAMKEALSNLEKNIGGSEEDTLHHRVTQMSGGIGDDFAKKLQGVIDDLKKEMNKAVNKEGLDNTIKTLTSVLENFETNMKAQSEKSDGLIKTLEEKINAQNESSTKVKNGIETAVTTAGTTISNTLEPISDALAQLSNLNTQLNQTVGNVIEFNQATANMKGSAQYLNNSASNTLQASDKLSTSINNFKEKLDESTPKLEKLPTDFDNVVKKSDEVVKRIGAISTNSENTHKILADTHSDLIKTNAKSVEDLEKSLLAYQQQTADGVEAVIRAIQKCLQDHQEATKTGLEDALKVYLEHVKQYQQSANDNINKTLASFDGKLASFATNLSSAVSDLNDAIDGLNERLNKAPRTNNRR